MVSDDEKHWTGGQLDGDGCVTSRKGYSLFKNRDEGEPPGFDQLQRPWQKGIGGPE